MYIAFADRRNPLEVYLGKDAGRRVLQGRISLGDGRTHQRRAMVFRSSGLYLSADSIDPGEAFRS